MGIDSYIKNIENRSLIAGGFSEQPNGLYRPDSTAWAVLALAKAGCNSQAIDSGRFSLTAIQLQDGRVSYPDASNVFWPTSLAVLAWHGAKQFGKSQSYALRFLLETSGSPWKNDPNTPIAHDASLFGWPRTDGAHSFVEPTALAMIALEIAGYSGHQRFGEGLNLLMNRQLPHGGWNYGNTLVYGKELYPFIDTTGVALAALAGHVTKKSVENSIMYLRVHAENCHTPLSLAWALFGLGAWEEFPNNGHSWIEHAFERRQKHGAYGTSLLSILSLAYLCQGDFRKCIAVSEVWIR